MSKFENVYELKEDISANGLTFFFVSKGNQDNFVELPKQTINITMQYGMS
jgi:YHS domain-containing protein